MRLSFDPVDGPWLTSRMRTHHLLAASPEVSLVGYYNAFFTCQSSTPFPPPPGCLEVEAEPGCPPGTEWEARFPAVGHEWRRH